MAETEHKPLLVVYNANNSEASLLLPHPHPYEVLHLQHLSREESHRAVQGRQVAVFLLLGCTSEEFAAARPNLFEIVRNAQASGGGVRADDD